MDPTLCLRRNLEWSVLSATKGSTVVALEHYWLCGFATIANKFLVHSVLLY